MDDTERTKPSKFYVVSSIKNIVRYNQSGSIGKDWSFVYNYKLLGDRV